MSSGTTFPGESDEYRGARDELLKAEVDLRASAAAVASQRSRLPLGGMVPEDYAFEKDVRKDVSGRPRRGPKRLLGWNPNTNLSFPPAACPARLAAS